MSFDAAGRGNETAPSRTDAALRAASSSRAGASAALSELRAGLGDGPFALVTLFVSADRDRADLARALPGAFGDAPVIGCATAAEIGPDGYGRGTVTALGFPRRDFAASVRTFDDVRSLRLSDATSIAREMSAEVDRAPGGLPRRFGLLLSDAGAMREEVLAFAFGDALGAAPLLGASTGGAGFSLAGGRFASGSATAAVLRTRCALRPVHVDAMAPSDAFMVITGVDADARRVREINCEPAAAEYARLCGLDPAGLSADAFASHPALTFAGGRMHPRAVLRTDPDGALVFGAAVEEGMVLRLARVGDAAAEMEAALADLARPGPPEAVLAFDSLLRRRAVMRDGTQARASAALRRAGAVGFASAGEQTGPVHSNGAFAALAFHPPGDAAPSPHGPARAAPPPVAAEEREAAEPPPPRGDRRARR